MNVATVEWLGPACLVAAIAALLLGLTMRKLDRLRAELAAVAASTASVGSGASPADVAALAEARAKAEAASEAKSRFLATVSHEFRTPLNGMLGMADLLLDTSLTPEQMTYLRALRGSAESFLSLIEEILDFSTIEAGRIELEEKPFAVESLVQGVVELLAPRAQDKGIEIVSFVARDVPAALVGDRDRLRQILFNLAGNAVKFTTGGGVSVSVERAEGGVLFAVADTGPGIAPENRALIFEEFELGGASAARGAGTGLGLAITRRLVTRMGGRIDVDSAVGRGSTFRVFLPLTAAHETAPDLPRADGIRALVVGASPYEPRGLARRLGEAGGRAVLAEDAEAAAWLLATDRFDVLLADATLGETAVRDLAAAARQAGVDRTIILLSPFERRGFGPLGAAGYDAYLTKPVRTRSLLERLRPDAVAEVAPAPTPRPAIAMVDGPIRVLLAEDNEINALLAVKALERIGALVDWARDGTEALAKAEAALAPGALRYDAILMDMRMPGIDGATVTRRIRDREAATGTDERCRIVALTASLPGERERYGETAGFDDFLLKPFALPALAAALGRPAAVMSEAA